MDKNLTIVNTFSLGRGFDNCREYLFKYKNLSILKAQEFTKIASTRL